MRKWIAVKLDFYSTSRTKEGSRSYVFDWLYSSKDNLTSSFVSLTIQKSINSPNLNAKLVLLPKAVEEGKTWFDIIKLWDFVVISSLEGSEIVEEKVLFAGFVTKLSKSKSSRGGAINTTIEVELMSFNLFFLRPFLNIDKLSDTMSGLLGVDLSVWFSLQKHFIGGKPNEIVGSLVERLQGFVSNLYINGNKASEFLTYCASTVTDLPAVLFSLENLLQGNLATFWSFVEQVAELQNTFGWVHEVWFDIIPESKLLQIQQDNSVTNLDKALPLPSETNESYYFCLFMRPNPLPYLYLQEPNKYLTVESKLSEDNSLSLEVAEGVEYNKTDFENIINSDQLFHEISSFACIEENYTKYSTDGHSVFGTQMLIEQSLDTGWGLPVVVDTEVFMRSGYNPLWITTRYLQVVSSLEEEQATEKTDMFSALLQMNLRNACYNGAQDLYCSGSLTTHLNTDISIGDVILHTNEFNQTRRYIIVDSVVHNISPKGSYTTIAFSRSIDTEVFNDLDNIFKKRFVLCSLLDSRQYMLKKYLPEAVADYSKALEGV